MLSWIRSPTKVSNSTLWRPHWSPKQRKTVLYTHSSKQLPLFWMQWEKLRKALSKEWICIKPPQQSIHTTVTALTQPAERGGIWGPELGASWEVNVSITQKHRMAKQDQTILTLFKILAFPESMAREATSPGRGPSIVNLLWSCCQNAFQIFAFYP